MLEQQGRIRYCSLSSSSRHGNAYLVTTTEAVVLVDYGVRLRRMETFMAELGMAPGEVDAIFVTHEHFDHTAGMRIKYPLHLRYGIKAVYSAPRTWKALDVPIKPPYFPIRPNETVNVGDISVTAIRKSHDAAQPLGFLLRSPRESLAVVTDLGLVEPGMVNALRDTTHVILESNHDVDMEVRSGRPRSLIDRVLGNHGHLSNDQAARALSEIVGPNTQTVLLAHLSLDCNTPSIALEACSGEILHQDITLACAPADIPGPWMGSDTETRSEDISAG